MDIRIAAPLLATALLAATAPAEQPSPAARAAAATDWTIVRVGGDTDARAEWSERRQAWISGSSVIDTALPEGYPAPTPPGAIDLKAYPSVRRAEITSAGANTGSGFMPLFRHIQRNDIAMTSPVEYDYHDADPASPSIGQWTMSFLYRTPELHPTGADSVDQRIAIIDTEPLLVVSLGGRGAYGNARVEQDIATLNDWLAATPEWEPAGPPRALMYNGPTLFQGRKWLEVQIPVRRAAQDDTASAADDASAEPQDAASAAAGPDEARATL